MSHRPKLLFVITDGGRARLVRRSPDNGHYETVEEIDGGARLRTLREELRASPPARAHSGASPRRATVGAEDYLRPAKEAFVAEVANRAAEACRNDAFEGVVLAAPSRLIGELRARIEGKVAVAGAIRKDLTKAPNSALAAWLNDVYANPQLAR